MLILIDLHGIVIATLRVDLIFATWPYRKKAGANQAMLGNQTNSLGAYEGMRGSDSQVKAKYATRLLTDIYHRVQPNGKYTLCGLTVSRVTSGRVNTLQLVSELPNNLTLCKHCDRIRKQDGG